MTEEQLQLLRAARLSGQDEHDADVAAARAAAAEDPALLAQLEEERQLDEAMRQSLREEEPPAGLEAALLAAMRAARSPAAPEPTNILRPEFTRRAWLGWASAAAATIAIGTGWWWREAHAFTMRTLTEALAAITKKGVTLSLMSMNTAEVADWLRTHKAPRADALPAALNALGRKGCHLYDIAGHPVSLECFLLPGMRELHLFSTPAAALADAPADGAAAQLKEDAGRTLATWAHGSQTMLLFSQETPDTIRTLLS